MLGKKLEYIEKCIAPICWEWTRGNYQVLSWRPNTEFYEWATLIYCSFQCLLPILYKPIPKKGNAKECSNYCTIALISHASKVKLKILQVRLQQYVNWKLPDVQARFRKGIRTRDQTVNIRWITKKQESSRKTSTSALLTTWKLLTVWITTNCGKFLNK